MVYYMAALMIRTAKKELADPNIPFDKPIHAKDALKRGELLWDATEKRRVYMDTQLEAHKAVLKRLRG